jgi:ribosome-binding protein aMBF1 (putative translation factor)
MDDLDRAIAKRKTKDAKFSRDFDFGYEEFKIGVLIREARLKRGFSQEMLARKIGTTKSVISRMENHAEDVRLSTLSKVAHALGRHVRIAVA